MPFAVVTSSDCRAVGCTEPNGEVNVAPAPDDRWLLGSKAIAAGSLHCDVWKGPAAELAARGLIAIYPIGGWWKYRRNLNRYNSSTRYSLVLSISSPNEDVQLYSEITQRIEADLAVDIDV